MKLHPLASASSTDAPSDVGATDRRLLLIADIRGSPMQKEPALRRLFVFPGLLGSLSAPPHRAGEYGRTRSPMMAAGMQGG